MRAGYADSLRDRDQHGAIAGIVMEHADCFCWSFGNTHNDALDFQHDSGDKALIAEAEARVKAIRSKRRDQVAA